MTSLIASIKRSATIVRVLIYHFIAFLAGEHLGRIPALRRLFPAERMNGAQRLRLALEQLGGAFIKFGQVMALQSDLLPLAYCRELFNLLDRVPPFPFAEVERVFRDQLGCAPNEVFDTFDRAPIATGSIGQVHVATLGSSSLAVKVRRPAVLSNFGADIQLMDLFVRIVTTLRLKLLNWMIAPTSEFVAWTRQELDYRNEARYMDAIAKNARDNPNERIPRVFWQYTTECILTTEYLEAKTVLDYMRARESADEATLLKITNAGFVPERFAQNLIDNFLGDAFCHGMFHADLHPANLMIMSSSRVGYIDFGIAGVLSAYSRQRLIEMTLAYTRGNLDRMCDCFFHVSAMEENASKKEFRKGLGSISREWYTFKGGRLQLRKSITAMMLDLLNLSKATGIWPQRDVVKYIRSAIALDGLIKSFAPRFDVGEHLELACDRYLRLHSLSILMLPKTMLRLMDASTRLGNSGMTRAVARLATLNEDSQRNSHFPVRRLGPNAIRGLRYSMVVFACAVGFSLCGGRFVLGFNFASSILIIFLAFALLALKQMRRTIFIADAAE